MSGCKKLQKHARKALDAMRSLLPKDHRVEVRANGATHYSFEIHAPGGYLGRVVLAASPRDADNQVTIARQQTRKILGGA